MGIPILNELNQETERLFIAGSRFSKDDVRLKKYIAPLAKMGEKAPVFLKMSEQLSELTQCEPEESATKLMELKSLLLSVLNTQGDAGVIENIKPLDNNAYIGETSKTYAELSGLIEALKKGGGNRLNIIEEAYKNGVFNDPRTIKVTAKYVGDGYYEIVNLLIEKVIPSMNTIVNRYLHNAFNIEGKSGDANRLKAIYNLQKEESLPFVLECLEKGSDHVKIAAIDALSNHPEYEDSLINQLCEKKAVKEAAINGLAKMDTEKSIDVIIGMLNSKNAKDNALAQSALAMYKGIFLTQKLTLISERCYEDAKNNLSDKTIINRLHVVFDTLYSKQDGMIAALMKKVLSERALDTIDEALSKEERTSLGNIYDKSLAILYLTGFDKDYIWDMFIKVPPGLLNKVISKKYMLASGPLILYAFNIGLTMVDAEQYYDLFFKTDLYKDVCQQDRSALRKILKYATDYKIPISNRIAGYFISKGNFEDAIMAVSMDDKKSISAIVKYYDENLGKNINSYTYREILRFAGENHLPEYSRMYEAYCNRYNISDYDKEYWNQYLPI